MFKNLIKKIKEFFCKKPARVDFICDGQALPSPLNIDEEKEVMLKVAQGDKYARKTIIEHNLRLVVYIAKKFQNTNIDIEDLISVGTIGLIKAIGSFDYSKNIKLATYASRCIENEILMHLRKVVKSRGEISLEEPLNTDWEGNVLLLSDILGTENDTVYKDLENDVEKEILLKAFEKLPKRELQIIKMRFGVLNTRKLTQKEIADTMGISQSYISRLEKKVLAKLKKEIIKFN
ncbi:MAG: RNA polymerase sporulation sigma factor SigK [Clostridia bacterium]